MKRYFVILFSVLFLLLLSSCSGESAHLSPAPKTEPSAPPITITTMEQAEFQLNKYIEQNADMNFEGAIVIIKSKGMYDGFQYAKQSGLHVLYENAETSKLPYRMKEVTPENSSQIVRIFIYDADFEADFELKNSMFGAINEKRYEDYAALFFETPNKIFTSDFTMLSDIGDEEAIEQKKGIYNIDKASDIEVLGVMPLDSVYAESWQKHVIPQTLSAINPNDPATIKSYFDKHNPMLYLVSLKFSVFNEYENSNEVKAGTQYFIIAVGTDNVDRKIEGIWIPQNETILEYEPDSAKAQEYLGMS